MKEDKTAVKGSAVKENEPVVENGKKKSKEEKPATKIVVRRLPPTMTEDQFKMQVSPLPDYDYFYFVSADMSLMPNAFCRAYINFINQSDLFIFTEKFDGYVFLDSKGGEFPAIVEFAPFQRIPKNRPNRKKDPKVGTIESDPSYIAFKEQLEAEILENKTSANVSKQHFFETCMLPETKELNNTPLLDFVKNRRVERQRIRDEKREEKRKKDLERRRTKEEQRRTKKEDDTSVVKVLNNQNGSKDRSKEKEIKQSFVKKKSDEVKTTLKDKTSSEIRPKDNKTRTGKSYLEERQRQAERREEQRKKLSQGQNSNTESKSPSTADEKTIVNEDKQTEEKPTTSENKGKDSENKKSERALKREEVRKNSYKYDKYESKRDRENDDIRRTRRTNNERSYQSNRRDEERFEDGGRKRYSESRRSHDSTQRDKYKDRTKIYGQRKTSASTTELDKNKNLNENSDKPSCNIEAIDESSGIVESKVKEKVDKIPENNELSKTSSSENIKSAPTEDSGVILEQGVKPKKYEFKDKMRETRVRRKSLDYDKVRSTSTYSSSKLYSRDKYTEKKRRNSVGSSKQNKDCAELNIHLVDTEKNKTEELVSEKSKSKEDKVSKEEKLPNNVEDKVLEKSENPTKEENRKQEFIRNDGDLPKRRNSTGERQCHENKFRRRNSLGSEDKNQVCSFTEDKFPTRASTKEDKPKDVKKTQRSSRDPRTERRIRNKDRPSIEIYRPGMGKFSKQRLEREKGLGSSTEVDSPSSSPSPTPVLKHKTVSLH